jgi:hypothetical protein
MTDPVIQTAEIAASSAASDVVTAVKTEAEKVEAPVAADVAKVEAVADTAATDVKAAVAETKSFVEKAKEDLENDGHVVSQFILHVEQRLKALEQAIEKRLGIKASA